MAVVSARPSRSSFGKHLGRLPGVGLKDTGNGDSETGTRQEGGRAPELGMTRETNQGFGVNTLSGKGRCSGFPRRAGVKVSSHSRRS
jgi:hypothetical protein